MLPFDTRAPKQHPWDGRCAPLSRRRSCRGVPSRSGTTGEARSARRSFVARRMDRPQAARPFPLTRGCNKLLNCLLPYGSELTVRTKTWLVTSVEGVFRLHHGEITPVPERNLCRSKVDLPGCHMQRLPAPMCARSHVYCEVEHGGATRPSPIPETTEVTDVNAVTTVTSGIAICFNGEHAISTIRLNANSAPATHH